jgi:hypothetical protein
MVRKHEGYARYWFDGIEYRKTGYFGCQLESLEWATSPAGTTRQLMFSTCYVEVNLKTTKRKGLKVKHTWGVSCRGTLQEHKERIECLFKQLAEL